MNNLKNNHNKKRIRLYFLISHGVPFFITILAMFFANSLFITSSIWGNIIYISMLSPLYAALFIIFYFYNKEQRINYFKSIINFKQIPVGWYIFIILLPILIRLTGSFLAAILTNANFQFFISNEMNISYALFLLFFGPIHEEMGWRGIALPELNKIYSFNTSVIYSGIMWAIWHLPLFFIENTYQNQLGLFTLSFWNFMLSIIFISIIYGLIYFKTEGSILAVILFHYFGNLSGETFILTAQSETFTTVLRMVIALIILYYYRDNKIYGYKNNP